MEALLEDIVRDCAKYKALGKPADYIPELAKGDVNDLGIFVVSSDGQSYKAGDWRKPFTIQSIVKPILLLQCLMDNGIDFVRSHIGVEATGKPFDAINVTEGVLSAQHLNPMVNMGAIFMSTLIKGADHEEKFSRLLSLTRLLAGNPDIGVDEKVYLSEKRTGNRNRALAFMLKTYGMIEGEVEDVLDCYFKACSIRVDCKDLANIAYVFANRGRKPITDERLFPAEYAHYVNAVLVTCGMYDGSGDFAVRVGVPAKSGVGGGIMAVAPTRMGVGIFSPGLDEKGNSVAGIKALEELSQRMYLSIF
ncbi:MAG: glutaminase A [Ruminococcaceae bacterium]|nr:glutaminase A [Oscillospiraceae bacterium]